ncbi:MAG: hypothetical protein K0R52_11 [Alphaproteobacteria bacterium]|jgi:hypothetical protein|nr:hypothetical protein [Alphaproteobacteria bacterium]
MKNYQKNQGNCKKIRHLIYTHTLKETLMFSIAILGMVGSLSPACFGADDEGGTALKTDERLAKNMQTDEANKSRKIYKANECLAMDFPRDEEEKESQESWEERQKRDAQPVGLAGNIFGVTQADFDDISSHVVDSLEEILSPFFEGNQQLKDEFNLFKEKNSYNLKSLFQVGNPSLAEKQICCLVDRIRTSKKKLVRTFRGVSGEYQEDILSTCKWILDFYEDCCRQLLKNIKDFLDSPEFYKGSKHPLTQEFWKKADLSDRLKEIKTGLEGIKGKIINYKINPNTVDGFYLERCKKILKWSKSDLSLMGCSLHLINGDETLLEENALEHAPAIIKTKKGYGLIVRMPDNNVDLIPNPVGIDLNDLDTFFQEHYQQKKTFLAWNNPIIQHITSNGGHNHLITVNNKEINFSIKTIKGGSGCDLIILSHNKANFIAIKKFKAIEIEEGLNELLHSLIALDINPLPEALKMARIYDAFLCPENCLNLIMEGANTHVIHHFLSGTSAEDVVIACAKYFAKFHVSNYRQNTDRKKYIEHVALSFKTLEQNLLEEENQEKLPLCLAAGQQLPNNEVENINSSNIIHLLPDQDQEKFARLVKEIYKKVKSNWGDIFRSCDADELYYFLTITHGDAHGNNFFYNDDKSIELPEDSYRRITMIDVGKIIRTYGDIGDPAEDVGRFLGSLWDWCFQQTYTNAKEEDAYFQITKNLQQQFIETYLKKIKGNIFTPERQKKFEETFREQCNFYKLRFYRAIFNAKKHEDKQKDQEIKIKILKSWMQENHDVEPPSQGYSQQNTFWLPDRPAGFISRTPKGSDTSYLMLLHEELRDTGLAILSSKAVIAGMGGIGKTSLALGYAHEFNEEYNLVYWLLSETETSLLKGYRNLLQHIGIPTKGQDDHIIIELVKHHVSERGNCLLIYDNVPNPAFLKGKIPDNTHILITSRCSEGWGPAPISLDVFQLQEAQKYLLNITGLEDNVENAGIVTQLAEALFCFPLALSHAAHYIKFIGGNNVQKNIFEEYLKAFQKDFQSMPMAAHLVAHFEERRDPFSGLEITYNRLIDKTFRMSKEEISPLAQELIVYCAYLDPDSIVKSIFLEWKEKPEIEGAFRDLCDFSLIKRSKEFFSIHRLVQSVIRAENKKTEHDVFPKVCDLFINKLTPVFEEGFGNDQLRENALNYLSHIMTIFNRSNELEEKSKENQLQKITHVLWIGKILYFYLKGALDPDIYFGEGTEEEKKKITSRLNTLPKELELTFSKPESQESSDALETWLLPQVNQNSPIVQFNLGCIFEFGIGIQKNPQKAFNWYEQAARNGHSFAQWNLGRLLIQAWQFENALFWIECSRKQGFKLAVDFYNLGEQKVEQADEEAEKCCTLAEPNERKDSDDNKL